MHERTEATILKFAGPAVAFLATWLVQRVLNSAWKSARGHDLPTGKDDDSPLGEIVVAAAVSGAVLALVRVLATRGGTRAAQRFIAS